MRRLLGSITSNIQANLSPPVERIWMIGRLLVALGIIAGTSLLLRPGKPFAWDPWRG